jgi:hypothetical protein
MNWYSPPKVERQRHDGIAIWRLEGDWTRDLPLDVRRSAKDALSPDPIAPQILDLSDLAFLDSWGEETIGDVLLLVHETEGRTAWVFDNSRFASYEGIRRANQRRGLVTSEFATLQAAILFVKSEP